MSSRKKTDPSPWADELEKYASTLESAAKLIKNLSHEPYEARRQLQSATDKLSTIGIPQLDGLEAMKTKLDNESTRIAAEFWGLFEDACAKANMTLTGTTNRRLVNRAVFIVLDRDGVKIEGVSASVPPFVPKVMETLLKQLQPVECSPADLKSFVSVLAVAYNNVSSSNQECSLEVLFRRCVLDLQKPTFWKTPSGSSFTALTRPMFRFRITELLRLGTPAPDGRRLVLGTTTNAKDAWELFSPGEQRVVIAGRLSFVSEESHNEP